jgi:hypothetical protein
MSLLYQPEQDEEFYLTPEYDATLGDWSLCYPNQPLGPGFTVAECTNFTFTWPTTKKRKT